jgi:hypothetical protein
MNNGRNEPSDRPLKALSVECSIITAPILPADLIYKTANGEDRLHELMVVVLQQDRC